MVQEIYVSFDQIGTKRQGRHKGGIRQLYVLDDHKRRMIINMYDGTPASIDLLVQRVGVPRWRVKKWAAELGLARQKEPFWTVEDEEYLAKNLHKKSIDEIAKTLKRTKTAVKLKAKRLGVNKTQEGYTMRGLCLALGCDHHKIEKWLSCGWLHGRRRQTERSTAQGGDMWLFTDREIRRMVIAHPNEIDPRRIDWIWMVDVLAGGDDYGIGTLARDYAKKEAVNE